MTTVVGALWGDEGKGKVTDEISGKADIVVKFQGGGNAGTTYKIGNKELVLHHIPGGVMRGKRCLLGPMMVSRADNLCREIEVFSGELNLGIDPRMHITMPYHLALDYAREKKKERDAESNKTSGGAIGTTLSGIGPSYEQQRSREGIRFHELIGDENTLKKRVEENYDYIQRIIQSENLEMVMPNRKIINGEYVVEDVPLALDYCIDIAMRANKKLERFVADVPREITDALKKGKNVLAQGAQGTMLDIHFGNYPKVTSSEVRAPSVYNHLGIAAFPMKAIGVLKAYLTKVGSGPVVTCLDNQNWPVEELQSDPVANLIRERGKEFGATTGRARRVGWPDMVVMNYSNMLNGFSEFALTRLDIMQGIHPIKLAYAYEINGREVRDYPSWNLKALSEAKPKYRTVPGFDDISKVRSFSELPSGAKEFVETIEQSTGVPVTMISVGPGRGETIFRDFKPF